MITNIAYFDIFLPNQYFCQRRSGSVFWPWRLRTWSRSYQQKAKWISPSSSNIYFQEVSGMNFCTKYGRQIVFIFRIQKKHLMHCSLRQFKKEVYIMFAEAQIFYSILTAWNDDPLKSTALLQKNSAYSPNTRIVTKNLWGSYLDILVWNGVKNIECMVLSL